MSNKKATKRALLTSVMALAMCVVMLVGTTFAWFTDTAKTNVNKIQAGTLDVDIVDAAEDGHSLEGETLKFKQTVNDETAWVDGTNILWEPGCTYELQTFYIKNKGNLALKYKIQITGIDGDAELNDVIDWTINDEEIELTEEHLAAGAVSGGITIKGHMQESASNHYQDMSIDGIAITVIATQDTVEYDSFNNTYDANAGEDEFKQAVTVKGIDGFEGREFATIQEAYDAISPKVEELCGLGQETCRASAFDAFYTDGGKITWTIYGNQTINDTLTFSFGRKASYYGDRDLTAIEIVGGNSSASINLTNAGGSIQLPYNWWAGHDVNTELTVKDITFDGIKAVPGATYANATAGAKITLDSCTFNGNLYSYHNYKIDLTIENCVFNAPASTDYAFVCQGANGGTVKFLNNTVSGYMRGINLQRADTEFVVNGNTFKNLTGKTENGHTYGSAIQLTAATKFEVVDNTIIDAPANALHIYKGCAAESMTIKDNTISAKYLCWNEATDGGVIYDVTKIISSGNHCTITVPGKCATKTAEIDSDFALN